MAQEPTEHSVTFYGLTPEDAHRLIRHSYTIIGVYWRRRIQVTPTSTDWTVEARPDEQSDWGYFEGPWTEHNALMFVAYWNRLCGWKRYRACPVMTEQVPPERGYMQTGKGQIDLYK